MSLYNGPARGGNRGGKDQFNWESVKSDKDREFYLGHSVKATTGRWQKGKDVFWYTREKGKDQAEQARLELQAIKQREEDLMAEAMGLKPKTIKLGTKPKLSAQDMAKINGPVESEDPAQPDPLQDPDAVKGLGYAPNLMSGGGSAGHEVMQGYGIDSDATAPPVAANGQAEALPGPPPKLSLADLERMQKEQKKRAKKAEKAAKKAKKAEKKAKKRKHKESSNRQPAEGNGRQHTVSPLSSDDSSDQEHARPAKQHKSDRNAAAPPSQSNRDAEYMASEANRRRGSPPRSNRDTARHATDDRQQHVRSDEHAWHDRRDAYGDQDTVNGSRNDRNRDGHHDADRDRIDSNRHDSRKYRDGDRRDDIHSRHSSDRRDYQHDRHRRRHDSRSLSPPRRRH